MNVGSSKAINLVDGQTSIDSSGRVGHLLIQKQVTMSAALNERQ